MLGERRASQCERERGPARGRGVLAEACRELRAHGRSYETNLIGGEAWAFGVNMILRKWGYR